jgi:hypothetical protein
VSQFDFSARAGRDAYGSLLALAVADGHDGWMEDFGEYTPLDSVSADGRDASATHNRYPTDYHCGAHDFARAQRRPIVRFQRSGWTGAARCAQVVWSGDPTTAWDFDGLRSVVTTGLGMGLSGVSRWGSDIGGFFSIFGGSSTASCCGAGCSSARSRASCDGARRHRDPVRTTARRSTTRPASALPALREAPDAALSVRRRRRPRVPALRSADHAASRARRSDDPAHSIATTRSSSDPTSPSRRSSCPARRRARPTSTRDVDRFLARGRIPLGRRRVRPA